MKVTLIGSGNVATVLGRKIFNSGHTIHQVFSRTISNAETLAEELSASAISETGLIDLNADLYIMAVSDDSLYNFQQSLKLNDALVVHTAGSVPMNILKDISANYGVLYPLQTLRKELNTQPLIPLLLDANNNDSKAKLSAFAHSVSEVVFSAGDEERKKLHLAAVITNNFSNHLYTLTEKYCREEDLDFRMILPVLSETVDRLTVASPSEVQTGPAARNDKTTIKNHMEMLKSYPELLALYEIFTESIGRQR